MFVCKNCLDKINNYGFIRQVHYESTCGMCGKFPAFVSEIEIYHTTEVCPHCNGKGELMDTWGETAYDCPECDGTGQIHY